MYGPFQTAEEAGIFWAGVLGLWFMSGVLNFGIAGLKGRNIWWWAVIGLVLGPLGLLWLILLKTIRGTTVQDSKKNPTK
jgi:hypothetical protein